MYSFHRSELTKLLFQVMFSSIVRQSTHKQSAIRISSSLLIAGRIVILNAFVQLLLDPSGLCSPSLLLGLFCCVCRCVVLIVLGD